MFEIIDINELLKRLDNYSHKELHVHHTWKPNHSDFNGSNGLALQTNMRNYHMAALGWADIGQHVTLLPDGKFVTGRDFAKTPASIQGYNTGGFACEMLGNFDTGNDVLEGAQKDSILRLAKYFNDKNRYIRFHRENSPKTCPGTSIDKDTFMQEVKDLDKVDIFYQAHVESIGWQETKQNGEVAGTEGKSLRMEALTVDYTGPGELILEGHVQNIGWQTLRGNGEVVGTVGRGLRLEAVRMRLENAKGYNLQYQAHVEGMGWMSMCKDGEIAGTIGRGLRLEAIKIKIVGV